MNATAGESAHAGTAVEATPVPTDRLAVAFAGDGNGVEELSWGQREIWIAIVKQGNSIPLGGVKPLPPGTTVQEIADELRYLMSRYQTLRTRLRFDAEGMAAQEVFGSGETELAIFEAGDADPGELAEAISARWMAREFDYAGEWPVRMAVVSSAGVPAFMVVVFCHLTLDGGGAEVMLREVVSRPSTPIDGMQPLEQARWQRSPAGRRHDAAAQRHWEKILRELPARHAPSSPDPRSPRHWSGRLTSRALPLAVHAVAQRTSTDRSAVLLALYAIAVGRVAGINPVAIRSVVSNRFRPGLAGVVCPVAQTGLYVIDVADVTVDEVIERARRANVLALKYSYRDPEPLPEMLDRVNQERGIDLDIDRFFNDRRGADAAKPPDQPVTPGLLSAALSGSEFRWEVMRDLTFERMFLHVDVVPDGLSLNVEGDTHHYGPKQLEALAWTVEEIAVRAAFDPGVPTEVSATVTDD